MVNKHIKHVFAVAILMVASYSLPQVKSALALSINATSPCPVGYGCDIEPKIGDLIASAHVSIQNMFFSENRETNLLTNGVGQSDKYIEAFATPQGHLTNTPSNKSGWHYVASVFDSILTVASYFM